MKAGACADLYIEEEQLKANILIYVCDVMPAL
jgi:hypothetical protein